MASTIVRIDNKITIGITPMVPRTKFDKSATTEIKMRLAPTLNTNVSIESKSSFGNRIQIKQYPGTKMLKINPKTQRNTAKDDSAEIRKTIKSADAVNMITLKSLMRSCLLWKLPNSLFNHFLTFLLVLSFTFTSLLSIKSFVPDLFSFNGGISHE